jgi:rhodanese-related sulfurtransferase
MSKIAKVLFLGFLGVFASSFALAAAGAADSDEIQALLKNEPKKVLVLDVRTPGEWQGGYIKGALLIPMREVPSNLGKIPKDKKIVVVCASGARSGAVASYLDEAGYKWVKNYTGGMSDWQRKGLPVEKKLP